MRKLTEKEEKVVKESKTLLDSIEDVETDDENIIDLLNKVYSCLNSFLREFTGVR
jgi:hypothetical protein